MTLRHIAIASLLCCAAVASAQTPWLHIYQTDSFNSIKLQPSNPITHTAEDDQLYLTFTADDGSPVKLLPDSVTDCRIGTNIPTIYITTPDCPDLTDLTEKDSLLTAHVRVDGNGLFDDTELLDAAIKGRGNSTWSFAKKPYRLKLGSKQSILGFKKSKNYVLLANYLDFTLMRNSIALKCAQLLGLPFTNHFQPVRLYFNGIPKGSYLLTEKIGINSTSVDIDETQGILFELDQNYDEPYKFTSARYSLPVMVKDPDLDEIAALRDTTADALLEAWQTDFETMEKKVYRSDYSMVDLDSFVDYLIVFNFLGNSEPSWPKSVFLYKEGPDDLYHFGPVWDFDWAGLYNNGVEDMTPEKVIFENYSYLKATTFFRKLTKAPAFAQKWAVRWEYFKSELYPQLVEFALSYADTIEPSALENGLLWPSEPGLATSSFTFRENLQKQLEWFEQRVEFISTNSYRGLFRY